MSKEINISGNTMLSVLIDNLVKNSSKHFFVYE